MSLLLQIPMPLYCPLLYSSALSGEAIEAVGGSLRQGHPGCAPGAPAVSADPAVKAMALPRALTRMRWGPI